MMGNCVGHFRNGALADLAFVSITTDDTIQENDYKLFQITLFRLNSEYTAVYSVQRTHPTFIPSILDQKEKNKLKQLYHEIR